MVLQVTQIRVRDVLGVREFAMAPGKVTLIQGKNGSGKSTRLAAIQAALKGGTTLAKLARVGAAGEEVKPEAVLVLEGDGEAYEVKRDAKTVTVRKRVGDSAAFADVARPQEFLASLQDGQAANPVAFLMAPEKERLILLLEALDLKLDRARLREILGDAAELVRPQPRGLAALEELALARQDVYAARTGVNRDATGKRASAEQCRRDAPAKVPDAPTDEDEARLRADVDELAATIARREAEIAAAQKAEVAEAEAKADIDEGRIKGALAATKAKLRANQSEKASELRAAVERQIADRAALIETEIAEETAQAQAALDAIGATCDEAGAAARDAAGGALAALAKDRERLSAGRAALGTVATAREHSAAARALHAQIDRFERDADELKARSQRLSDVIDGLERYRAQLAAELPIEGLEIVDGQIRVGGVPYDQLNTAQRVSIAVKVALLRAAGRPLPLVFVDGAEALDEANFEALCAELEASEVQAFVARVTEDLALVTATRGAA